MAKKKKLIREPYILFSRDKYNNKSNWLNNGDYVIKELLVSLKLEYKSHALYEIREEKTLKLIRATCKILGSLPKTRPYILV